MNEYPLRCKKTAIKMSSQKLILPSVSCSLFVLLPTKYNTKVSSNAMSNKHLYLPILFSIETFSCDWRISSSNRIVWLLFLLAFRLNDAPLAQKYLSIFDTTTGDCDFVLFTPSIIISFYLIFFLSFSSANTVYPMDARSIDVCNVRCQENDDSLRKLSTAFQLQIDYISSITNQNI